MTTINLPSYTTGWLAIAVGVVTFKGELAGIPPTGKSATVTGMAIDPIVNGKMVESWGIFDQFGMLQQLGVIPAPGQSGG